MAHEFESGFFVHQPAWHGLGTVLDNPPTCLQALERSGLDWDVELTPVYTNEFDPIMVPDYHAVRRSSDARVLGVVGKNYHPLQNREAFAFFDGFVADKHVALEAAGSLRNGQVVWILARILDAAADVAPGDTVAPFFLLSTGHDGHTKLRLGYSEIRVVCMNTMRMALAENAHSVTLRHTRNVAESLLAARECVDLARRRFMVSVEVYRAMERRGLDANAFRAYVVKVFGAPGADPLDKASTPRNYEALERLFESGPGAREAGRSVWGAYNAVTHWLDFERGRSVDSRTMSSWFGEGAEVRERAHREAVALSS